MASSKTGFKCLVSQSKKMVIIYLVFQTLLRFIFYIWGEMFAPEEQFQERGYRIAVHLAGQMEEVLIFRI